MVNLGINEAGTHNELGLHARIAVSSALSRTDLEPRLLYTGARNAFTEWMEARGVRVIDVELDSRRNQVLAAQGLYPKALLGHWLRSQICLLEMGDEFVVYTDCDVLFVEQPDFGHNRPEYFACAPEFKVDNWNYCNTGVMIINVPSLRRSTRNSRSLCSAACDKAAAICSMIRLRTMSYTADVGNDWIQASTGSHTGASTKRPQLYTFMDPSLIQFAQSWTASGIGPASTGDNSEAFCAPPFPDTSVPSAHC